MKKNEPPYIYILLIGEVEPLINLKNLEGKIREDFNFPIKTAHSIINPEDFYDPQRKQHHSTAILKEMLKGLPHDALSMIGLIPVDLFIPILTFVFGEAQLGGKVGIVSLARLRQEFYGLPPNDIILQRRLLKETKHELGHIFDLVHCSLGECVMSVANNIADVDSKSTSFCLGCKELLLRSQKRRLLNGGKG